MLSDTDWSYSHEHSQLEEEFAKVSAQARADEFKKMSKALAVRTLMDDGHAVCFSIETISLLETSRKRIIRTGVNST